MKKENGLRDWRNLMKWFQNEIIEIKWWNEQARAAMACAIPSHFIALILLAFHKFIPAKQHFIRETRKREQHYKIKLYKNKICWNKINAVASPILF